MGKIKLSAKAKAEIQWWINNIDNSCHHINISNSDITIYIPMKVLQYYNVIAVSLVNNMGDIKSQTCNNIAYRIWDFCAKN